MALSACWILTWLEASVCWFLSMSANESCDSSIFGMRIGCTLSLKRWPTDKTHTHYSRWTYVRRLPWIPSSQCSTLVRNTVVRAIHCFNGKMGNLTLRGFVTPEPIEMKLCMVDYVTHPTPHAQFDEFPKTGFGGLWGWSWHIVCFFL